MAKKKNAVVIGQKNQDEYESMMNQEGWMTYCKGKSNRWEKNKDIFNQFDIMGMKYNECCLVQVKTNRATGVVEEMCGWIQANMDRTIINISYRLAVKKDATKTLPARWDVTKINRYGEVYE